MQGEPELALRVRSKELDGLRGRATTYEEQEAVRAAIAVLELAVVESDDPMRRFSIVIQATGVGRHAAHAAPAWAERDTPVAKTRTYAPTFRQIEAASSDAFTTRARDTIADLTSALLGGPSPLGSFLSERAATAERVDDDWMASESLRVVLSLAAFVVDRELVVAALTELVALRTSGLLKY